MSAPDPHPAGSERLLRQPLGVQDFLLSGLDGRRATVLLGRRSGLWLVRVAGFDRNLCVTEDCLEDVSECCIIMGPAP